MTGEYPDHYENDLAYARVKRLELRVFSNDPEEQKRVRMAGELANNETAKSVISYLEYNGPAYLQKIAKGIKIDPPLVYRQIIKLEELGFVQVTVKPISRRTKAHKFYGYNKKIRRL